MTVPFYRLYNANVAEIRLYVLREGVQCPNTKFHKNVKLRGGGVSKKVDLCESFIWIFKDLSSFLYGVIVFTLLSSPFIRSFLNYSLFKGYIESKKNTVHTLFET